MHLLKSEIDKFLRRELGSFLKQYGYKYLQKADGFVRYFDGGFNEVVCAVYDYKSIFYIGFSFLIRIDQVEDIRQLNGFFIDKFKKYTCTVSTSLKYFNDIDKYEVLSEIDLIKLINEVKEIYKREIDPFLIRYSDVKNIDKTSNVDKIEINMLSAPENILSSIIIAKLAGNPEFEKLSKNYYNDFAEKNRGIGDGMERIKKTIEYLRMI